MAKALTAAGIEKTKATDKRQELPDGIITGLYLIVQPSGKKAFALRYRFEGKTRKLTLGRYPQLSLKDARLAATDALEGVGSGSDPMAQKQADKAAQEERRNTVSDLLEVFEKRHLSKLRTGKQSRDFLDRFVIPAFGNRDVRDIKKRDVIELLDSIVDAGKPTSANRVLSHFRKFLNWAVERDIIEINPATGVKPPAKEIPRERFLSDNEIRLFWQACEAMGQPFGQFGKMLLLTGQRRGEVAGMTDAEIDGGIWKLSPDRTKNKRAHEIPMSDAATAVLESLMLIRGKAGYIFTTTGDTPISGLSKAHRHIIAKMVEIASEEAGEPVEIPHWRWHDLRRTCETGLARLRVPQDIIDRVTNHISGQHRMVRIYNQHEYADEKREALELWAQAIDDILAGVDPIAAKLEREGQANV
jgi:integrase